MTRFSRPSSEAWTDAQRVIADKIRAGRGSLDGPFGATLHCPPLADLFQEIGAYIRFGSEFPSPLREMAILIVAQRWDCGFERSVHAAIAKQEGLSDATIQALCEGRRPDGLNLSQGIMHQFVASLAAHGRVDEATFTAARNHFGEAIVAELVGLVGYYTAMAFFINVDDVPETGHLGAPA